MQAADARLRRAEGAHRSGGSLRTASGGARLDASDDEAPWFDARDCFEGQEAQLDEGACVVAAGALEFAAVTGAAAPGPAAPLDDDHWLPPGGVSPHVRDAALAAMRRLITAPADTAACALLEDRSPATLERFLRARDFDASVAAALFLEHRAWRQSFGWSVSGAAVPQRQYDEQKIMLQALSRAGAPLLVMIARRHNRCGRAACSAAPPAQNADLAALRRDHRDMETIKRYIIFTMDKIMDALRPGGQFMVLLDLTGLTRHNIDLKALITCFDILQKYYVERVQHIWFAQPPTVFWAAWRMVMPFVAPKTREKIAFLYGADVPQTLLRHYNAADIPVEYGGTGQLRPIQPGEAPWEAPGAPRQRRY